MSFFKISTLADYGKEDWCFTTNEPKGIGLQSYKFGLAEPLRKDEIEEPVTLQLDDEHQGLKKGSFIGNVSRMLIVNSDVKTVFERLVSDDIDYHKFNLLDHKGKLHSEDYWIVNPFSSCDVLHLEESDIDFEDGEIDTIWSMVFDKTKIKEVFHLFRGEPIKGTYFISQELKAALEEINVTNLVIKEIPIA